MMYNMLILAYFSTRKSRSYGEKVKVRFVCFSGKYLFQKVFKINFNTLLETTNEWFLYIFKYL